MAPARTQAFADAGRSRTTVFAVETPSYGSFGLGPHLRLQPVRRLVALQRVPQRGFDLVRNANCEDGCLRGGRSIRRIMVSCSRAGGKRVRLGRMKALRPSRREREPWR